MSSDDARRMSSIRILTGGRTAEERKSEVTDDIDAMDGPELSAAVAREVMGWRRPSEQHFWITSDGYRHDEPWSPDWNRNNSHRVLLRCKELGIVPDLNTWIVRASEVTIFALLTIDPAIVCRAALRAVRASRD